MHTCPFFSQLESQPRRVVNDKMWYSSDSKIFIKEVCQCHIASVFVSSPFFVLWFVFDLLYTGTHRLAHKTSEFEILDALTQNLASETSLFCCRFQLYFLQMWSTYTSAIYFLQALKRQICAPPSLCNSV